MTLKTFHLRWTFAVGVVSIVGLIVGLHSSNALDMLTGSIVAIVILVWFMLEWQSRSWQKKLDGKAPAVAKHLLVHVGDEEHLPDGLSLELATQAALKRGPPGWLGLGATTLISLGLAGTFLGLTLGLFNALPLMEDGKVDEAINALLNGAKLAFVKSLAGIYLAMIWNFRLMEVRENEDRLVSHFVRELDRTYPPITPEKLLALTIIDQHKQSQQVAALVTAQGGQAKQLMEEIKKAIEQRIRSAGEQAQQVSGSVQHLTAQLTDTVAGLRGEDTDSLTSLRKEQESLKETLQDLAEHLPDKIGLQAGRSVGTVLQPKLEDLSNVLQALGTTGTAAVSEALTANMGDEVSELRTALLQVSTALATLPGLIAAGSNAATATLDDATAAGAKKLADAAGEIAKQTHAASGSVVDLREALAATQEIVAALQGGGAELRDSFAAVAQPLQQLPQALEGARSGVEAAGRVAEGAATRLEKAGDHVAERLQEGATSVAETLARATATAGGTLTDAATEAGKSMQSGGDQLAGQVQTAAEVLRDGVASELLTIRDSLRAQRDAQAQAMESWKAERALVIEGAEDARQQLVSIHSSGIAFSESVEHLRVACEDTVSKLDSVTGDQRQGADDAIQQLLAAVGSFSQALEDNKSAIKDASLHSVATTEQVTAAAARQVADALVQGAQGLKGAMERAEQLGQRITEQSAVLVRSLEAADNTATSLEAHGAAMVDSGRSLKEEVRALASPLSQVRGGLERVAPSVQAAASAMEDERKALVGLGQSLQDQAKLIREQEAALTNRTTELRKLHEVLGQQWSGHVGRMTEAHQQVRQAWQQAMQAASTGLERNAEEIAKYATKVENALGLKGEINGLQSNLGELVDALSDLTPTLGSLGGEVQRLQVSVDGLNDSES